MQWNDIYVTNNEVIDAQHKELVRIVNELENSQKRGDNNIAQNMSSVLTCVKYCIEVKQKFLSDISFSGIDKQRRYYDKTLTDLLNFFTSAEYPSRKKVAFIVGWLKQHLLFEKEALGMNSLPQPESSSVQDGLLTNNRKKLEQKYEKLKALFTKRLIDSDDFKEHKAKIFSEYIFEQGLQDFDTTFAELDELQKSGLISENEKAEYITRFLKRSGIEEALDNITEIEGKLLYLKALAENRLISEEKFIEKKNDLLAKFLNSDSSPNEENEDLKEDKTLPLATNIETESDNEKT